MKTPSLALGVFSLAVILADHPPASAQSTDSPCAFMSIGIVTGAAQVFPGTALNIGGSVRNCSTRKARYTLVVSGVSSCGQKAEISTSRVALGAGESKSWSIAYTMPAETCSGIWEASAQLQDGRDNDRPDPVSSGRGLAGGTATVIVD
jgi:hypothetical protein